MKIKVFKSQLQGTSPTQLLRRAGYALIFDRRLQQESFARRFGRDFYPRFHLYVQDFSDRDYLFFNLHLDQKKASYAGQTSHSADYDGDLVTQEAVRLQSLLPAVNSNTLKNNVINTDVLNSLQAELPVIEPKKQSFWSKLFN